MSRETAGSEAGPLAQDWTSAARDAVSLRAFRTWLPLTTPTPLGFSPMPAARQFPQRG